MLTYRTLNTEAYADLRYQVLLNVEETGDPKETAYLDSKGIPTIGIGFNLKANMDAVLRGFKILPSDPKTPLSAVEQAYRDEFQAIVNASHASNVALNAALNEVMSRHYADTRILAANRTRSSFQFLNDTEIRGVFDELIPSYETKVNNWFTGIPESPERAILVSLAWNNASALLGNGLKNALISGNRAEAWYEIRYNSNGDKLGGIAKRRYYESELFGLYDNPTSISDQEAKQVFRMYTEHKVEIDAYESTYGAQIAAANNDYHLSSQPNQVDTLIQSLQPAREYLIAEYVTNKGINISINGEILVGEDGSVMGVGGNDTLQGKNLTNQPPFTPVPSNDLLFGEGGNDNLDGLGGDDVLYGGDGDDILTGGTGIDVLIGGKGNDTLYGNDGAAGDILDGGSGFDTYYADDGDVIRDSDGKGVVYLHGKQLILATRHKGERAYKDALGNIYILNGLTLEVNDPLVIENFTSGDFGLELKEENDPDDPDQSDLAKAFADSKRSIDPIVIDLDGNGFPTRGIGEGAFFDYDGNGFAERTSWISPGDGLLVRDLNANDKIDDGTELFGNYTLLKSGQTAAHGYAALVDLDDNLDGQLDSRDSAWNSLKVWQDTNSDGLTDSGELKTIAEVGIQSIGVTYSETATTDSHGNLHLQQGSFQKTDGSIGQTEDIWLRVNKSSTRQVDPLELNEAIRAMPEIKGMGNVASLRQVMASDPSGPLQYLVQQFAAETNPNIRSDLITKIIYAWTGVENMDPGSRGVYIGDARKIYALEALVGETWINVRSGTTPLSGEAAVISSVFAQFSRGIAAQLMEQTWYKEIYRAIYYSWNSATQTVTGDLTGILPFFVPNLLANREQGLADLSEFLANLTYTNNMVEFDAPTFLDALAGFGEEVVSTASLALRGMIATSGNDRLLGQDLNETIHGKGGHDFIWAGGGDDQLFGDDGGDFLYGQEGNDTLDGGAGNDLLDGGEGNDVYLFRRGSGQDTIMAVDASPGKRDVVRFGDGITPGDIELSRSFDNLILKIRDTRDRLVVNGYFINDGVSPTSLEAIEFFGGAVWDFAAVKAQLPPVSTEGSDQIYGFNTGDTINGLGGDDVIDGRGGDDILIGGAGNDTLDGGVGNDYLYGGAGSDTFLFNLGYGQDTILDSGDSAASVDIIQFGAGILEDDISFSRSDTALILNVNGTSDQIRILNWFAGVGFQIEQVKFADATIWDAAYLQARASAIPIVGTSGNDYLVGDFGNNTLDGGLGHDYLAGYEGNDTLDGGVGNDSLAGGVGNDIYVFGRGYGQDTVYEYDVAEGNSDTILLKSDVAPGDVSLWRDRFNLVLGIVGTSDVMTLQNWFADLASRVERIEFSDGTVWDVSILEALPLLGTSASDYLVGGPGKDVIEAGAGDDTVYAGGGNDIVNGGTGNDYLYGDVGNDIVNGGMDNDYLDGGEGNDTLDGETGDDYLDGGTGNDTLIGGIGNDYLSGGDGSDTYLFARGDGQDSIEEYDLGSGGQDIIRFAADIQPGEVELSRDSSSLFIKVLGTEDQITVSGFFDSPAQRIERVEFADGTVWATSALLAAKFVGTEGADSIYGTSSNDVIEGRGGDDYLYGDAGADTLDGGTGNDTLDGGAGNDTYVFAQGYGQDTIYETSGTDTLRFAAGITVADVFVWRDDYNYYFDLIGTSDRVTVDNWYSGSTYRIENVAFADGTVWNSTILNSKTTTASEYADFYWGTGSANTYDGLAGDDRIYGFGGNDTLNGGAGNDFIDGGIGNDVMSGGLGDDIYVVDSATDSVVELTNEGNDTVQTFIAYTLGANVENLVLLEVGGAINGTGNELDNILTGNSSANVLTGGAGNDQLDGGAGNDTLDGGTGADIMIGGAGNDTYIVDDIGDVVFELAGQGADTVQSSISYVLGENVEKLTLTGTAAINGTGNELNNTLTGNAAANTLNGGAGDDTLNGGAGADTMIGGTGDDTYTVDNVGDVVVEYAGEGIDTVRSSIDYALGNNLENLTLTGSANRVGTGNAVDNVLIGNTGNNTLYGLAGNDFLDGGAGADTLVGGTGDDTYIVDNAADIVTENAGEGTDTVQASITYTLDANAENLVLLESGGAINGTGNGLDNIITGNSANNTLNGGAGADTLIGGMGDDIYVVDALDTVIENVGEGIDTVQAGFTYTLGANIEKLTLTGAAAINGYGNELDNTLTGNSAANVLAGGLGNDIYVIGSTDTVVENFDEGVDTVQASFSYTLTANVENLTLTGSSAINGTGNALDNTLTGNAGVNVLYGLAGNDWLDGKAGADTMVGGSGDDTYVVDNTGDVVTELADEGIDTVRSTITYTLGANVENLILTGSAAINGTGNALDNVLTGNTGTNSLFGGAGNDTLNGGTGADTMVGGVGDDIYYVDNTGDIVTENAGEGNDSVISTIAYTLGANLENLTLSGSSGIAGTGNSASNIIIGNGGANTLWGRDGDDMLFGGAGADSLNGENGNDFLDGGTGNDTLTGGTGNDTYILDRGYGTDTVVENDATAGNTDVAQFLAGISADQIWFKKATNNLEVSIIGTSDKLVIKDWYLGNAYHVEQFKTTDGGKTLTDSNVQNLVNAMASFAPPAAGQTTLPTNYQTSLAPVIAANWQ